MAGLLSGLTGGGGGVGGPLDGLLGGDGGGPLAGLTGGLGDTLSGVTGSLGGLTGGLLGGGEGLSVLGLVGIGSDEPNLLDLNPAEKKTVKAQKAAQAKKNEQKRQAALKQLQEQVKKQGTPPTPEQLALANQIQQSQAQDDAEMAKLDNILGPTDPQLLQQAVANGGTVPSNSPSSGLFYAYLVNGQTAQPTHVVTFANASVADSWYRQASAAGVEKVSAQMYMYRGATAPGPFGGRMAIMPINTVQPILPLQRADGYPICCKPEAGTAGLGGSGGSSSGQTSRPPRQRVTHDSAAGTVADTMIANGDQRPRPQIVQEVKDDLAAACPGSGGAAQQSGGSGAGAGGGPLGAAAGLAGGLTEGGGPLGAATGLAGGLTGGGGGGPLGAATGLAGGLTGGGGGPLDAVGSTAGGLLSGGPLGGVASAAGGLTGGGGPLGAVTGLAGGLTGGGADGGAGGLLGGLLGSGQGLNVLGILAIGSDDPALLDLNPAEKKAAKAKKVAELTRQKAIQQQQLQELQRQVQQQGGKPTPQQEAAHKELVARDAALTQAAGSLQDSMRRDDANAAAGGLTNGLPVAGGLAGGLPTQGLGL